MTALTIRRLNELGPTREIISGLDSIFFASSNMKSFASEAARAEFRECWLGRYIELYARNFYVSLDPSGNVAGYLAGCLEDPAETPRFSDIAYFSAFKDLTRRFPAHLHINFAPQWRGRGAGSALMAAFLRDAAASGSPGAHVVTGAAARNVGFYKRNGFEARGTLREGGNKIVFLGRDLTGQKA